MKPLHRFKNLQDEEREWKLVCANTGTFLRALCVSKFTTKGSFQWVITQCLRRDVNETNQS